MQYFRRMIIHNYHLLNKMPLRPRNIRSEDKLFLVKLCTLIFYLSLPD